MKINNKNIDYTIALVGQPNSGKSTLFNVLADIKVSTSNFSGTSVQVSQTVLTYGGLNLLLVDLPGTYSLNSAFEYEKITFDYLINSQIDLIINVVDASLLTRSLELTVELSEIGKQMLVALNMYDEAINQGIDIDGQKLSDVLGTDVVTTMAIFGKGVKELMDKAVQNLRDKSRRPSKFLFTSNIERSISSIEDDIEPYLNGQNEFSRLFAIKAIENPELLNIKMNSQLKEKMKIIEKELIQDRNQDVFEIISYERHHIAMKLSKQISKFKDSRKKPIKQKFDELLLHPFFGYFFLLGALFIYFFLIFIVGDTISGLVETPLLKLTELYEPLAASSPFLWYSLNGAFMGVMGVFGIVLPYFLPLIFLTSVYEETGYTSRIAFLLDGLFHKIGLHGKSIVPFILGFGCTVPALYASRIIESKRDRMITGILLTFIPCSARIAVIFALAAAFTGPLWAMVVFAFVLLIISISGKALSKVLTKPLGLILEIPNLKLPSLKISLEKTWGKLKEFMKEAVVFLMFGSILLGWFEYFHLGAYIDSIFAPVLNNLLDLPIELGSTLVFGFLRKELIIVMATQALGVTTLSALPMTVEQIIVFVIFVTLYFPCLATFIVMTKEFGWKTSVFSAVFSIAVATISALLFKIFLAI